MIEKIKVLGSSLGVAAGLFLVFGILRGCSSLPERDLLACFKMIEHKSGVWEGSTSPDSAKIATCDRYDRKETIFKLCGVHVDESGKWQISEKPIYDKTGRRTLDGFEICAPDKIVEHIGNKNL